MEVVLFNSADEGRFTLTDEMPDGRCVVRISNSRRYLDGDYLPDDRLGNPPLEMALGAYVFDWATEAIRSDAGINAALLYLRQSPEYGDVDSGDLALARSEKEKFMAAARSLFAGENPTDQMFCEELRAAIDRWTERLSDCGPDSDEARILAVRTRWRQPCSGGLTAWAKRVLRTLAGFMITGYQKGSPTSPELRHLPDGLA